MSIKDMKATKPLRSRPLPYIHLLGTGTPRCAGCGGEAVREIYATEGEKMMASEIP